MLRRASLTTSECYTVFIYFFTPHSVRMTPSPLGDDYIPLFCYVETIVRRNVTRVKLNRGSVRLLVS